MKIFSSIVFLIILLGLTAGNALAHDGEPHSEENIWDAWNFSPSLLVSFLAGASLYIMGIGRLWNSSAPGMGVSRRQITLFFAGLLALAVALISPLDALAGISFSWHMVQHLLLVLIAVPLIILGDPILAFLWVFPKPGLRRAGRWWNRRTGMRRALKFFSHPLVIVVLYTVILWIWHAPVLYQAALRVEWIHNLEHLSFLTTALLFWWLMLPRPGAAPSLGYGPAVLILFVTMLLGGLLGAFLTFSSEVWYPIYQKTSLLGASTALEDQALAGLLMWIPPSLVHLGFALSFLAKLLNSKEEYRGQRLETLRES